ncbi:hypothetical protein Tco_0738912 [Tanacetum coccineum]
MWLWKSSKLVFLKGMGCEALVKRDTPDNLNKESAFSISQTKISGRAVDLEEIQEEEDTTPSEITSNITQEVEGFEPPQEEVIPIQSNKWIDAMNAEYNPMMNKYGYGVLVDLPHVVLVAKGFTQTYGVDYEETFSPVADIRDIDQFLISIAAYYGL